MSFKCHHCLIFFLSAFGPMFIVIFFSFCFVFGIVSSAIVSSIFCCLLSFSDSSFHTDSSCVLVYKILEYVVILWYCLLSFILCIMSIVSVYHIECWSYLQLQSHHSYLILRMIYIELSSINLKKEIGHSDCHSAQLPVN